MERQLSVLLVEDEPDECMAIKQYIESLDDVNLIGITNDSETALEYVCDYFPDVIILDLELHKGKGNGMTFLNDLKDMVSIPQPYILVTTNNISSITHEKIRYLGVDFIMIKSQGDYSAKNVIDFLLFMKSIIQEKRNKSTKSMIELDSPNQIQKRIHARIITEIDCIGISPKAKGRSYLIEAISLLINGEKNSIYSTIAKKYEKTDTSVERAMQNAIAYSWRNSDIDDLQKNYTARISTSKGVPTITEFIYYYKEKIKIEYNI